MAVFILPGIPFTVITMLFFVKLWRKGMLGRNANRLVETGIAAFFKAAAIISVLVYIGLILFITLMWNTLGVWAVVIGLQTYLILALCGFIFTGKI